MKKRVGLVVVSLALTGCDGNAIKFADATKRLLQEYQKKITDEIAEATGFYQRNSAIMAEASWRRLNDGLSATRDERSTALAADYEDSRKSPTLVRSEIREYVLLDAEQRKQSLATDVDTTLPYLERLVALEADKEKVAALSNMLEALAKPRSLIDEGKELQKFVDDTKNSYAKLVCDDQLTKQKAAATSISTCKFDRATGAPQFRCNSCFIGCRC